MPFEPGGNFDDKQQLFFEPNGDVTVATKGPLTDKADLREICVWIFQRQPEHPHDVAATEMSTTMKQPADFKQTPMGEPNREWSIPARKLPDGSDRQLGAGPAVAMAIGFFLNHDASPHQFKVLQWAQSVELLAPPSGAPAQP